MHAIRIKPRQLEKTDLPIFSELPEVLARIYATRGVSQLSDLGRQLNQLIPDVSMKGMPEAVERISRALLSSEKILIVGDFDCDGATSTSVAVLALRMMGATEVDYLVPNRFEYGYGLSPEIVEVARQRSPKLVITVDNGISSIEGVALANQYGIDVVVTDHHLPGRKVPDACAIVNPNQHGCPFEAKSTCGVGVIFYVMIALRRRLIELGWFSSPQAAPNLASLLDLVALGTVADVVALEQNNRVLVYQGIQRIRSGRARPGILALIQVAGREREKLVASDMGFALAPRLNAAGRLEDMSIGIECLLTDDPSRASELAEMLNNLNHERRFIEQEMQQQALEVLDQLKLDDEVMPYGICLYDAGWHQGVVGILASRIKEKLHRPVIAFAPGENGLIKGSARSIPGFHIRDGLDVIATQHPELLTKFGGHAMAAGMTLNESDLDAFRLAFDEEVRRQLDDDDLEETVLTDGWLTAAEATMELAEQLRDAGPWGHHFPEPLFQGRFRIIQQRIVGQRHLKMVLMDIQSADMVDAIWFNCDTNSWPDEGCGIVQLLYRVDINEFRGNRSVQLIVQHLWADAVGE